MSLNDFDCTKSESHSANCDKSNHYIGDRISGEKQGSDNLKGPK